MCAGLEQEETLVVVVSKTFTTAETMLNARTVRTWLTSKLGAEAIPKHVVAVSTNAQLVQQFGIDTANMFGFWDWVGGRYSVCSAVGILPLALQYGFAQCEQFLAGAHSMDEHFRTAPFEKNVPVMMGLLSLWNSSFLGNPCRAILPYCQALSKLPPHIQQVRNPSESCPGHHAVEPEKLMLTTTCTSMLEGPARGHGEPACFNSIDVVSSAKCVGAGVHGSSGTTVTCTPICVGVNGKQRQGRGHHWPRTALPCGRGGLRGARHKRAALVLPAHPPGPPRARRVHRRRALAAVRIPAGRESEYILSVFRVFVRHRWPRVPPSVASYMHACMP